MIGIVVVSHSRALAESAVALASEMVALDSPLRVAVAAGVADGGLGTDATAVAAAIEAVDGPDGVLVLLDLGSAVLSAELAVELLPPDPGRQVRLSAAPLVEGLVAALVLAATGADLDAVATEAEQGLAAKRAHLGDAGPPVRPPAASGPPAMSIEVTVTDPHGLHARPAAAMVALASRYDAGLQIENLDAGTGPADARSLSAVATLDARSGHRLRLSATGPQAAEALRAFERLPGTRFTDDPRPRRPARSVPGSGLDLALGPALVRRAPDLTAYAPGDVAEETRRSRAAVATVDARLADLEQRRRGDAGAILGAQRTLLTDPEIIEAVAADLAAGVSATEAWQRRLDAVADRFAGLADPYQRERAADVRSVQHALLRALTGTSEDQPDPGSRVILVVDELDVATATSVDPEQVAGIVVAARGRTGHGVIVAGSRGIPLFTGAGAATTAVASGQQVAFDARRDRLWTSVSEEQAQRWPAYVAERQAEQAALVAAAQEPAVTGDGVAVPVLANLGSLADAELAAAYGADGSGLVRTEMLFADRVQAPSVAEQAAQLRALAEAFGDRPLTVRTWDIGGDKLLPFLPLRREPNPFLGVRGVRAFLGPGAPLPAQLLADQLAAIARTAPVGVLFPMVTHRGEVDAALALLREAVGSEQSADVRVGIMIETPTAALGMRSLAAGLDFVSIGTNDLTAYVLAADRGSDAVADLADPLTPAVLRLIDLVVRERPDDVTVAVCGDLASRPDAVPLLLGLGVQELSCAPPMVPEIKAAVRRTELASARALAVEAIQAPDPEAVRALLSG